MSLIVAARFETFDAAQVAASRLMEAGITPDRLHTFYVNPAGSHDRYPLGGDHAADPNSIGAPSGAVAGAAVLGGIGAIIGGIVVSVFGADTAAIAGGAGVGAYVGSLVGAMRGLGRSRPEQTHAQRKETQAHEGRSSGVVLAVHTEPADEKRVGGILRDAGGAEVERAKGNWRDGKWEDFDPLTSPELERDL
ncbi:hypothetical protein [Allopusillimonas ginsengisoli]|uniref:hypothetical protein n=1 Tax=Allopusillimonas ginsengisoli TaxID=453575 RepID=UPI001021E0AC|nr:hypothetical protein [Allopusillimonas ginsengisoli]TEA77668.1 hypothetical protein ERE07_13595 [Allopusillimonas ginsengisoli]